ncbi:hypothetical protein EMIHUDRAFT_111349 [Emiliania huxleyi CCMP1516]|uniref:peptidylprolyl isomerase n=2 Tax=Emiliania huxleyi TaxID=2903 RepID=A0A0D3KED8_EMIH1|nr:hypothetical protein EMIHUDRAFT_111349 [Emiliania huxleyi CCMP1516]EOD34123.1 hypothetical protein EMIHUDRAFT_111349 [Emiliania huxleyi CCMP1516]|eukprot:XP_005786552.1 hypothetical protein EMIHUDRAFT_111349 [Emiliania huxleyi CCMP1516]
MRYGSLASDSPPAVRRLVAWLAMTTPPTPLDLSGDGGCLMTTLREPLPTAARASAGVYATVRFRAALADGTVLHDSWEGEAPPLQVRVGAEPSDAALGWDLALPRMRVGQQVRLECGPSYAYGDAGAPPLIPPSSPVTFELELLSVRDLMSSHNPDEAAWADGGGGERSPAPEAPPDGAAEATPNPAQADAPTASAAAAGAAATPPATPPPPAAAAAPPAAAAAPPAVAPPAAAAAPPAAAGRSAWVDEGRQIEGRHVSGYSWVETEGEIEISCPLPAGGRAADVRCEMESRRLAAWCGSVQTLLDGPLSGRIDVEGSGWSVEGGGGEAGEAPPMLLISLRKHAPGGRLWGYPLYEAELVEGEAATEDEEGLQPDEPGLGSFGAPGVTWAEDGSA